MKGVNEPAFKTGPNPMGKDYIVATKDGARIICHLQRGAFDDDAQMHAIALIIEDAVSNKQGELGFIA